jgi:hypothetical protein
VQPQQIEQGRSDRALPLRGLFGSNLLALVDGCEVLVAAVVSSEVQQLGGEPGAEELLGEGQPHPQHGEELGAEVVRDELRREGQHPRDGGARGGGAEVEGVAVDRQRVTTGGRDEGRDPQRDGRHAGGVSPVVGAGRAVGAVDGAELGVEPNPRERQAREVLRGGPGGLLRHQQAGAGGRHLDAREDRRGCGHGGPKLPGPAGELRVDHGAPFRAAARSR